MPLKPGYTLQARRLLRRKAAGADIIQRGIDERLFGDELVTRGRKDRLIDSNGDQGGKRQSELFEIGGGFAVETGVLAFEIVDFALDLPGERDLFRQRLLPLRLLRRLRVYPVERGTLAGEFFRNDVVSGLLFGADFARLLDLRRLDLLVRPQFLLLLAQQRLDPSGVGRRRLFFEAHKLAVYALDLAPRVVDLSLQFLGLVFDQLVERLLAEPVGVADMGEDDLAQLGLEFALLAGLRLGADLL